MSSPYEMFKTKEMKIANEPRALDYGDFKIFVKYGGGFNRQFIDAFNLKMRVFERRVRLAQDGRLDAESIEILDKQRNKAMAEMYADHVIIGWEGVTDEKGKKLDFSRETVIKLLTDLDPLFADIIEQASKEANFAEEERAETEKNLSKS